MRLPESRRDSGLLQAGRWHDRLPEVPLGACLQGIHITVQTLSIALIYNLVSDPGRVDIDSIADGVTSVRATLERLGHRVTCVPVNQGVIPLVQQLSRERPDVIFNLCEGYGRSSAGEHCVAGLLELLGVPYTGSGPVALALALDKPLAKRLFVSAGIPTPPFRLYTPDADVSPPPGYPVILKLASEDASVGITSDNVVHDDAAFRRRLGELFASYNTAVMAEGFIDGREFTVALLDGEPLALEEIEFTVKPRIVCYDAKWRPGSAEFVGTTPRFAPDIADHRRSRMLELARRTYDLLGIRDYGRVDFRMDARGEVYVLEANPNPDITPGSGFCLALQAARFGYEDFLARLLDNARRRRAGS